MKNKNSYDVATINRKYFRLCTLFFGPVINKAKYKYFH